MATMSARSAVVAAVVAVAAAVFSNSLHGGFVIDDGSAIRTNKDLRPETPLSNLLVNDYWGRPLAEIHSVKSYRPLTVLTFRANFAVHGLDVEGYHLVNVVLHAACTGLVAISSLALFVPGDLVVASVASLAFAVHPVHCEAVASIVGRAELLCCLCFLLCLLCHRSACRTGRGAFGSASLLVLAAVLAVLATASKETGITAPVVAAALDVLAALPAATPLRARTLCALRCALGAALVGALFTVNVNLRGEYFSPSFSFVDNPLASLPTRRERVLSALHIHVRYARLLLWPSVLSADYSYDCVPAVHAYDDGRNLASAALYLAFAWLGLRALWAHRRGGGNGDDGDEGDGDGDGDGAWRACGRALTVLLVPMIPASHLLLGIGTLVAERLLYLPSVGYCVLFALAASRALRPPAPAAPASGTLAAAAVRGVRLAVVSIALLALAGLGGAKTLARNEEWHDSDSITRSTARACPNSAKAMASLGTLHLMHNQHDEARAAFRDALRIHPTYCDALQWLGRMAFMEKREAVAEPLLLAALEINAGHPEANLFAGLCAARRGDHAAALARLTIAHQYAPHNAEIVRDYGATLLRAGHKQAAREALERAVGMFTRLYELGDKSKHGRGALASAHIKLAAALLTLNAHAECLRSCRIAVQVEPTVASHIDGLRALCTQGQRDGIDTSQVDIDLGL